MHTLVDVSDDISCFIGIYVHISCYIFNFDYQTLSLHDKKILKPVSIFLLGGQTNPCDFSVHWRNTLNEDYFGGDN